MLQHIGILTFGENAPDDLGDRLRDGFAGLVGAIPGLLSAQSRTDLGLKEGNGSFVFQLEFDSVEAWRGYFGHPAHQAVSHELVLPYVTAKTFVQVEPDVSS